MPPIHRWIRPEDEPRRGRLPAPTNATNALRNLGMRRAFCRPLVGVAPRSYSPAERKKRRSVPRRTVTPERGVYLRLTWGHEAKAPPARPELGVQRRRAISNVNRAAEPGRRVAHQP